MSESIYQLWEIKHRHGRYSSDRTRLLKNSDDKDYLLQEADARSDRAYQRVERRSDDEQEVKLVEESWEDRPSAEEVLPVTRDFEVLYKSVVKTVSGDDTVTVTKAKKTYYVVCAEKES